MARYLGDSPVAESELIPGQCVKVVHSCIKKMTESKWNRKSSNHREEKVCVCVCASSGRRTVTKAAKFTNAIRPTTHFMHMAAMTRSHD